MTGSPPTGDAEQRWQQPAFGPAKDEPSVPAPSSGAMMPASSGGLVRVPPPSTAETVLGVLAKLIWPVAIVLIIFSKAGIFPLVLFAIVAGIVLEGVRKHLRQRRRASARPSVEPDDQR